MKKPSQTIRYLMQTVSVRALLAAGIHHPKPAEEQAAQ